jgi:hypothetical protein
LKSFSLNAWAILSVVVPIPTVELAERRIFFGALHFEVWIILGVIEHLDRTISVNHLDLAVSRETAKALATIIPTTIPALETISLILLVTDAFTSLEAA